MQQRTPNTILFILSLLVILLARCTSPASPPILASWSEQYAAAEAIAKDLGCEFVLSNAAAFPLRDESSASDKSIELRVTLVFQCLKSTGVTIKGVPGYASQSIYYSDHYLATTLSSDNIDLRPYAPKPTSVEQASMIQIGPQDALQLTLMNGETYMEEPVDHGNTWISLVWDLSEDHPESKNALTPTWDVTYYRENIVLHILVDAQTGAILKSYEENFIE